MKPQGNTEQQLIKIVHQLMTEAGVERKITLDVSLHRHLGIDSLGKAELFQRIEKEFSIQLPDTLLAEAETLNDIFQAIQAASPAKKIKHSKATQEKIVNSHVDPSHAKTLIDVLLLHAITTPDRPHIYMQDEHGKEEIITYSQLLENSLRVAGAFLKRGLRPGETIAIMQPTNPGFFYTFFGTLLAGCIPVPIYPPFRANQIESYAKQEANILRNAEARMLVTFHEAENLSKLLRAFIPSLKEITTVDTLLKNTEKAPIYPAKEDDFALIQYTSGSTSAPKGVLLTYQNLLANIRAYGEAIAVSANDVTVSWVPLYHDLGLIGMWFGSLYHGLPLTLMSPLAFLSRPERWLWAMHYHRGTISGGPNFAYELCVRKIEPEMIEGLDLSSWRLAVNGAEAIQPKTLERFTKKFAPYGFKAEAFFPVYGLAESTVCVATSPLGRLPRIDVIDRKAFEKQNRALTPTAPAKKNGTLEFVGCGKPIPRHEVRVVDEENQVLPERHIGLLQFKGPSSMQGYYGNPEATQAIYHDGWWDSGDLAYLADGEVFITGRKKDVIIKAGRNLYPTEIEDITSTVPGVRKGCIISFGISDPQRGTEKLIIVAETAEKKPAARRQMVEQISEKITTTLDVTPDHVVLVSPGVIPKTSSGKLQRSACKTSYLAGKLTKQRIPAWLQIAKLGIRSASIRVRDVLSTVGKAFYTFYVVLLLSLTMLPIWLALWIFPRNVMARVCKIWARVTLMLVGCPLRVTGKNNAATSPVIYAANHASYIDPFVLLAILPRNTCFIGKQEVLDMPFVRTFVKKLGYLTVNRLDSAKGVEDTKAIEQVLKNGSSILIFPEGTFSYAAGLRPFKLGAFKVAAETNISICPIALDGTRHVLRGEERLLKPGKIKITFCEAVAPQGKDWQEIAQLKNTVRAEIANYCGEPTLDLITTEIPKQ